MIFQSDNVKNINKNNYILGQSILIIKDIGFYFLLCIFEFVGLSIFEFIGLSRPKNPC